LPMPWDETLKEGGIVHGMDSKKGAGVTPYLDEQRKTLKDFRDYERLAEKRVQKNGKLRKGRKSH